jgi:hypothetical protein
MGFLNKVAVGAVAAIGAYVVNKVVTEDAAAKQPPAKRSTQPATAAKRGAPKAKRPGAKPRAGAKHATAKTRKVARAPAKR